MSIQNLNSDECSNQSAALPDPIQSLASLNELFSSVSDLIQSYLSGVQQNAITSKLEPGQLASAFSEQVPNQPIDFKQIFSDIENKIIPGLTHWQHPNFFAYYPATSSIPAILSEAIIAAFGAVGLQWSANPIATELECKVMDWLALMMGAEDNSPFLHRSGLGGGIIQNTAGESLVAVVTAARFCKLREIHPELDNEAIHYQDASKLIAYFSDETHFSGVKACRVAGIRHRKIPATTLKDGNLGIQAAQVENAMIEDRANGLIPCFVQLNFGSTNTCGFDDLASFHDFRKQHHIWVHVDAAYAGPALILPEFQDKAAQLFSAATSFNFNGSKWLLCGFDSAFLFVRSRQLLTQVFSASDNYMAKPQAENHYNPEFKDWSIPLGRRFRALRIWMVLSYFGRDGLQRFLRSGIEQANWLRRQIDQSPAFKQTKKTQLGLVCLSIANRANNEKLIERLAIKLRIEYNCLVYPSRCLNEPFIRIAIGGANTALKDVKVLWKAIQESYQQLIDENL